MSENTSIFKNKLIMKNRENVTDIIDFDNPLLKVLFEQGSDIVYLLDLDGHLITANPAFGNFTGYILEEVIGLHFKPFVADEDLDKALDNFNSAKNGKTVHYDLTLLDSTGAKIYVEAQKSPLVVGGEIVGVFGILKNDTNSIAEEVKHFYEEHDSLTKLPNVTNFCQTVTSKMKNQNLAILLLDIDQFELVNETLGHLVGEQLLKEVANRLLATEYNLEVGRIGYDQFVILLEDMKDEEEILKLTKYIQRWMKGPYLQSQHEYILTSNIGIAIYPQDGTRAEELVKAALIAMQQARNTDDMDSICFFREEMLSNNIEKYLIKNKLKTAIENNGFVLHYQPRVNTNTNEIIGMEALIRWDHPIIGRIPPLEFIPIAEETGLIVRIGEWVLRTACKQNKEWQEQGLGFYRVSVNVSAKQLLQPNFDRVVQTILDETGLDAQWLELEITESMIMQNEKQTCEVLYGLKNLGVKIAIDDFGTGYSSLSYLRNFPVDILKIDRSFINDITHEQQEGVISKAIISLGQNLGLDVVAEGVENPLQLTYLRALNCQEAQGYFFSEPLCSDEFRSLLERNSNEFPNT